jgi:hypothetical protein
MTDVVVVEAGDYDAAAVKFLKWAKKTYMYNSIMFVGIVRLKPIEQWTSAEGNPATRKVFPDGAVG